MICSIHQPQFLPYLGYLNKIASSDMFVFLDNVQFKKNEFQNRNRIILKDKIEWLTVPVSFSFGDPINKVKIANSTNWQRKMETMLEHSFARSPYFKTFNRELFDIIEREWNNLAEINEASVLWLMKVFEIERPTIRASEIDGLSDEPTMRLIDICKHLGADTYLSGAGGHDYLDVKLFEQHGIKLQFQQFVHPEYEQLNWAGENEQFVPYLSAIDGLFNCGGGREASKRLNIIGG